MLKPFYTLIYIFLSIILFISCNNNKQSIKESNKAFSVKNYRFDQLQTKQKPITTEEIKQIETELPQFFKAFNQTILHASDENIVKDINQFKTFFDTIKVNEKINSQYSNISNIERSFEQMQKRLLTAETNYTPNQLITINSGFNYKNFLLDNAVVVGLDMYLNDIDYESISPNFPAYKVHTFNKEYILPDIAQSILTDLHPDQAEQNSLLDKMLYQGKILEYKQQLLPNSKANVIIGMTEEDYQWCANHERDIYRFFVSENLLYDINFNNFKTYIMEGPYSSGMPEGAPANTASYIGWQIIKEYIKQTKEPIYSIIKQNNSQEILNKAQYRP